VLLMNLHGKKRKTEESKEQKLEIEGR
jgi:hypothetical protein